MDKSSKKAIVKKLKFNKEQREDIDALLMKRGPRQKRLRIIAQKYQIGLCHRCLSIPDYKIIYPLDGITLVEYYCKNHYVGIM